MGSLREILAKNLSAIRKNRGFKQVELAGMLEISPSTYNQWESGFSWPSSESLEKLAKIYNISPSLFFSDHSSQTPNPEDFKSNHEVIKKLQEAIALLK